MSIPFLDLKTISECNEVNDPIGGWFPIDKGAGELEKISADVFYQIIGTIAKPISPTDPAPTALGWFKPQISSELDKPSDPNSTADWGTIYSNAGNLRAKSGYDTLFYHDAISWKRVESKMPQATQSIAPFSSSTFPLVSTASSPIQRTYDNAIWQLIPGETAISTDVPGASSKWVNLGTQLSAVFDPTTLVKAQGGKQIYDYMVSLGLIASDPTYRFFDDFSANKGWIANPTFPITPSISGGIMTLAFTAGQNQGVQIPLSGMEIGKEMQFKVRLRKTTSNASILAIGTTFGVSTTATAYKLISATSTFTEYIFNITPVAGAVSNLSIGIPAANNFGDTYEIDIFKVDEKLNEGAIDYRDILGTPKTDLNTALSNNSGAVYLRPITYTVSAPIEIPSNTFIKGVKGRTKIVFTGSGSLINLDSTKENITIEDVIFDGSTMIIPSSLTADNIKARTGIGSNNCIVISGYAKNVRIQGCEIKNFNGCGIKGIQTHTGAFVRTAKILNNVITNCYMGMLLDTRAEYHQFYGNSFCYNNIGAWIEGGNNIGGNNHFNANCVGVVVSGIGANNDTHGSISASLINHNINYSIFAVNVNNGYTFTGCHCFQGDMYIENSKGVVFSSGIIAAGIISVTENSGYNILSGNIFFKSYNGGTITGSPTKFSMNGNRFIDGSSSTSINNSI